MLTVFGVLAAGAMVLSYALEARSPRWIAVFALACAATALYAVLSGAWIFAILESVWAMIATRRFLIHRSRHHSTPAPAL